MHDLKVYTNHRVQSGDRRAQVHLQCPDCDLVIKATINPATSADHFIESISVGHRELMKGER